MKTQWLGAFAVLLTTAVVAGMMKQHEEHASFVAYDAAKKTITIKMANGQESSGPLLNESAIKTAAGLKAGDAIMLTCDDDDKGNHVGVSKLMKSK